MNLKYLDSLKSSNYSNEELIELINTSHIYFLKNTLTISDRLKEDGNKQIIFSSLVRFFRSINANKKIEEGALLKETFKNSSNIIIELLNEKVNEIITTQSIRINYSDNIKRYSHVNNSGSHSISVLAALKSYKSMSFKVNVIVSNKESNRVLKPEIILTFLLNDGEKLLLHIDIKIFQELRRVLAYHIKKMIDNEAINFLRN